MVAWLNFWNIFFWICLLGFLLNSTNLIALFFFAEITWVSLYCYSLISASINDDLNILSFSFFILALAAIEFSIGLFIALFFKNYLKSTDLTNIEKNYNNNINININKLYLNRFIWKK